MKQYYRESTRANLFKKIINQVFNIDLTHKCRQRNFVNARMLFTKMMREDGAKVNTIASFLNLESHASVLHYLKNINFILKYDKELDSQYQTCLRYYKLADPRIDDLRPHELKGLILVLEDRNKLLSLEIQSLQETIHTTELRDKRFKRLFDLIRNRTKPDTEEVIEKKLNTIFNGVYD